MRRMLSSVVHVAGPILAGGLIYLIWRSETLRMFRWFEAIGAGRAVSDLREIYGGQHDRLPEWLLYSLPDAAWVYSFSMYMGLAWIDVHPRLAFSLMAIGPCLGIAGELGQALRAVPGTFDPMDLYLSLAAWTLAGLALARHERIGQ